MKRLTTVGVLAVSVLGLSVAAAANAPVKVAAVGANVVITGKATNIKGTVVSVQLFRNGVPAAISRYTVKKDGSFTVSVQKSQMRPGRYTLDLIDVTAKTMHPIVFSLVYRS